MLSSGTDADWLNDAAVGVGDDFIKSSTLFNDDFKTSSIDIDDFASAIRVASISMDEMMSTSRDSLPNVHDLVNLVKMGCAGRSVTR